MADQALMLKPCEGLQRIIRPNPFDHHKLVDVVLVEAGKCLGEYLEPWLPKNLETLPYEVGVYLDGELIPPERLTQVIPRPLSILSSHAITTSQSQLLTCATF